jgi:hypothetical protein
MRLRRLEAGELRGPEADALRTHVESCLRCQAVQAELSRERSQLLRELPFDQFAAGIAEKLAETPPLPGRTRRLWQLGVPLAAAAAVAVVALPLLRQPIRDDGNRVKGEAGATLFVKDSSGSHELTVGQPIAEHAQLLLSLRPSIHRYAAAALWERDSVSLLFVGPAKAGPLPTGFEWDGHGRATLVLRYADQPIDSACFVAELQKQGPPDQSNDLTAVIPIERP